ncbi:MAG: 2-amino-4-hydroxy-6-hydroxymethyldihydropteridine diphosphokinase [Proteobacteria bacterium]|nr:2-amino-4-hydroxy-6-hydroxymethyldihydropteridine diphosphokinase [Pseudomonadota bacterium]MBU4472192.1 2-amino-4-hydroxy-6-hydroxymethyldihydropteridine diphosphokinase [Pseudomonadota bacterium]MCG2750401.1 2-amino-4-hydroxy-6-hydroxymethyldihydropteridine diphosphokinase [Desulfobacteraceae bacterium]
MKQHTVYLSVGSNLGDKTANCQNGIEAVADEENTLLVGQSPYYKTEPVGFEDQDWFINGVFCIQTLLAPEDLLARLKSIQEKAGRKKSVIRNGPRILDLDILLFDDLVVDTGDLVIPHPRMHERRFVLQPFCDISPDRVHPVLKKDMQTLLAGLSGHGQEVEKVV